MAPIGLATTFNGDESPNRGIVDYYVERATEAWA